jgi:hypothetical protein
MHLEHGIGLPFASLCTIGARSQKISSRFDTTIFSAQGTLRAFAQPDLYLYSNHDLIDITFPSFSLISVVFLLDMFFGIHFNTGSSDLVCTHPAIFFFFTTLANFSSLSVADTQWTEACIQGGCTLYLVDLESGVTFGDNSFAGVASSVIPGIIFAAHVKTSIISFRT